MNLKEKIILAYHGWFRGTWTAVTPHDTNTFTASLLYVKTAGDVKAVVDGADVTYSSVEAGTYLPKRATLVYATGTTSTDITRIETLENNKYGGWS